MQTFQMTKADAPLNGAAAKVVGNADDFHQRCARLDAELAGNSGGRGDRLELFFGMADGDPVLVLEEVVDRVGHHAIVAEAGEAGRWNDDGFADEWASVGEADPRDA